MKLPRPFACLLLGLAACQSSPTTPAATEAAPVPAPPAQMTVAPTQPTPFEPTPAPLEFIEYEQLTINGQRHREISTRQLLRQLGRPDSIAKGAIECGAMLESLNKIDSPNGDWWYYGTTMYEVGGTQAVLSRFDVTTGMFQGRLGKLVLNKHTTVQDVGRYFPLTVRDGYGPAVGGQADEELSLPFSYKGTPTEGALNLLFKQGRLQAVEFFYPC